MKEKTVEQIANQRQSGKTYLAMDEETKLKIEALYVCYNLNCHQIGDIVDWPWQSCSKHIKVMNDRIEYGKTTFEKLEAQGEQTIAKYGLDLYVNGIPEVPKEAPVVEPEQLATEFPEIVQPTQEPTSTESEISVPPVEDVAKAEEKAGEVNRAVESEFRAELVKLARDGEPEEKASETKERNWEEDRAKLVSMLIKENVDQRDSSIDSPFPPYPTNEGSVTSTSLEEGKVANHTTDPEHDKRVRKDAPFYVALQNIIDRYEAGEITFEGMMLDESRGIFRVDYAIA